jgi:hypothetical protein
MSIEDGSLLGHRVSLNGSKELIEVDLRDYLMDNPMADQGDIIVGATLGVPYRLKIGEEKQVLTVSGSDLKWQDPVIPSETAYYYNELSQPNTDINQADRIIPGRQATIDLLLHDVGQIRGEERFGAHDVDFDIFFEGSYNDSQYRAYVACRVKIEFMALVLSGITHYSNIKAMFHGLKTSDISQKAHEMTDQDFLFAVEGDGLKILNNLSGAYEIPVYMKYNYRVRHYETLTQ